MRKAKRPTTDAVEILHRRYYQGRPDRLASLDEARANDSVARKLTSLRLQAGLTQRQLAKLVGTTASVICRLEDADYEGHSLAMLNRIAAVLKQRIEIRFVPATQSRRLKRRDALTELLIASRLTLHVSQAISCQRSALLFVHGTRPTLRKCFHFAAHPLRFDNRKGISAQV